MKKYEAVKKKVSTSGVASLGWFLGRGYVQETLTVRHEKWCVIEAGKPSPIAICKSEKIAKAITAAMNGDCNE
jgi:hypothetical protein